MALILHVILTSALLTGLVSGTQLSLLPPGSRTRAVGGNMEFTTIKPPSPPFQEITWRFQGSLVITRLSGSDTFGSGYSGRVHLDTLTGSLELQNLTLQDSGEYTVSIRPEGGAEFSGKTNLTVLRPVSLSLVANETEAIESQSTIKVTCAASGSFFTVKLYGGIGNGSSYYNGVSGKLNLTTYKGASRGMAFMCQASNEVSGVLVEHLSINVHYGPDEPIMAVTPKRRSYHTGSIITLSCSSESSPAAQFQWALNGTLLGRQGPELRMENIQANQSGAYSCWAYNGKTGTKRQSKTLNITVADGLSGGVIAGIVIGSLLAVAALISIAVILANRVKPVKACYRTTSTGNDTL